MEGERAAGRGIDEEDKGEDKEKFRVAGYRGRGIFAVRRTPAVSLEAVFNIDIGAGAISTPFKNSRRKMAMGIDKKKEQGKSK